jgi:hypothetical protein
MQCRSLRKRLILGPFGAMRIGFAHAISRRQSAKEPPPARLECRQIAANLWFSLALSKQSGKQDVRLAMDPASANSVRLCQFCCLMPDGSYSAVAAAKPPCCRPVSRPDHRSGIRNELNGPSTKSLGAVKSKLSSQRFRSCG